MLILMPDPLPAPPIELWAPTRWDALPAGLYRVGEPLDVFAEVAASHLSPAIQEAVTERYFPRQSTRRRRWISVVFVEEPRDMTRPPHERPALCRALAYGRYLSGGLLFEKEEDLGSAAIGAAAIVHLAMETVGACARAPGNRSQAPGTFTIGDLGGRAGRRPGANASTRDLTEVERHVENLASRHAANVGRLGAWEKLQHEHAQLDDAVTAAINTERWQLSKIGEHAIQSAVLPDLRYRAACDLVHSLCPGGKKVGSAGTSLSRARLIELLSVAGFLNRCGNRGWNRETLDEVFRDLAAPNRGTPLVSGDPPARS